MKNCKCKRNKLNNAGMTLIEILIAVAILTIAIVPMLYGFVYVSRFNAKGRELQQSTVLAHTVMENCKAFDAEEIEQKMRNTSFIANAIGYYEAPVVTDVHTFYLDDITMDTTAYDVAFTLSPYGDKEEIMNYNNMNAYLDGVFKAQSTLNSDASTPMTAEQMDVMAYSDILEKIQEAVKADSINKRLNAMGVVQYDELTMPLGDIEDSFKSGKPNEGILSISRSINIGMTKDTTTGVEKATITYTYNYALSSAFEYKIINISDPLNPVEDTQTVSIASGAVPYADFVVYDNTDTLSHGATLQNLYVFYYPGYKGVSYGVTEGVDFAFASEEIFIRNYLGRDVNVYLIKQKDMSLNKTNLGDEEVAYKPKLKAARSGTELINLYHNLSVDISGFDYDVGFNVPDCFDATTKSYFKLVEAPNYLPMTPEEDKNKNYSLIQREEKQLMYNVKVTVYKNNAYDTTTNTITAGSPKVVELDGTMLNW